MSAQTAISEVPAIESFPYKKEFLQPEELWTNAVDMNLAPLAVVKVPRINDPDRPKYWRSIPRNMKWEFQGKMVAFVVSNEAYGKVNKLVDFFSEEPRMKARRRDSVSPYDFYQQNHHAVANKARELSAVSSQPMPFRHWLREAVYEMIPECTTFKISVTKSLFKYLGSKIVLDPSAGWGDRLLGAAAAGVEVYHGVDPNPALRSAYDDMLTFVRGHRCGQNYYVLTEDFLSVTFVPGSYDTIFTSPPYCDYEIYSDDPKQSITGRRTTEIWLTEFLHPYLRKAWDALASKGYFTIYISDTRHGKYVANMHHFITNELHGNFLGIIAMTNETFGHGYPIWVWRK